MNILNRTRKTVIAEHVKECKTILSQGIGLMFRTNITPLLFVLKKPQRITIHTFFMLKTIDVIFLDENKKVVDCITIKPWTWHTSKEKVKYIIEVLEGTIERTKTRKGDSIDW